MTSMSTLVAEGWEVFLAELEVFSCGVIPNTYRSLFRMKEHVDEKCTLLTRDSLSPLS